MSASTIRVGVIGAGSNTVLMHLPGLQAQKDVEVVAVANRSRKSAVKVAKRFGIPTIAESWEDIIYDDDIDAICIGTWPYLHAALTVSALEAGKHVLCEARMAMNSLEAHAMLEASQLHPRQVAQIVPAPMTLKIDRTVLELISSGYIGDLITLDARIAPGSHFPQWHSPVTWRHERDFSGNNIMFMGIYYECFMRWIGPARSVQALGQTVVKHRVDANGCRRVMSIPDHVDVLSEMEQGGHMRMLLSSVVGHMPGLDVYVCGTEGTLRIFESTGELQLEAGRADKKKLSPVRIAKGKQGVWRVEEEFINAIRGKEIVTHTDFVTGVKYMEWTDAVTTSMRAGRRVHLPLECDI